MNQDRPQTTDSNHRGIHNYWRFQPVATWESSNYCGAQGLALSPFIPPAGGNLISLKPVVVLHAAPTRFLLNDQAPGNIVGMGAEKNSWRVHVRAQWIDSEGIECLFCVRGLESVV
jgi:hypothetical protein